MQLQRHSPWSGLLPDSVVVAWSEHDLDGALSDEEAREITRAVPSRRAEFTTGRVLARRALAGIGIGADAIPVARSGAPLWPTGVVGSITHCAGLRACAVGRRDEHAGIGIDATPSAPLPAGVLDRLTDPSDTLVAERLDTLRRAGVENPDSLLLAASEAVAKARTSAQGSWPGIDGARVLLAPDGSFAARARRGPDCAVVGRWALWRGTAVAGATLADH